MDHGTDHIKDDGPIRSGPARHRVPVVLVSGVQEEAMLAASISLQFGLPNTVSVRHTIAGESQVLTRVVSDVNGVIEREEISLAHACVSCAIREDIVPTLERLAARGCWSSIVACLPVGAEALQVCRVLSWAPRNAPHVTIAGVVAALDGATVVEDLLGEDLLDERGLATSAEDRRGVAEVASAMVEYADLVSLTENPAPDERALVTALSRPQVTVLTEPSLIDAAGLVARVQRSEIREAWIDGVRRGSLPPLDSSGAWRLDLVSDRPFHPIRFRDEIATLGGGPRRSRGCFWLPTRPDRICLWSAAGGQASVGSTHTWGRSAPLTRIIVIGLDDGAEEIAQAFDRCLLTVEERSARGHSWVESWDGLEPWLGPIEHVA